MSTDKLSEKFGTRIILPQSTSTVNSLEPYRVFFFYIWPDIFMCENSPWIQSNPLLSSFPPGCSLPAGGQRFGDARRINTVIKWEELHWDFTSKADDWTTRSTQIHWIMYEYPAGESFCWDRSVARSPKRGFPGQTEVKQSSSSFAASWGSVCMCV